MTTTRSTYLAKFTECAIAAGLPMKKAGTNWAPMRDLVSKSHISLSVTRAKLQVNLNNEADADRSIFGKLEAQKQTIEKEVGWTLIWEQKPNTKKTAIRAELEASYDDLADWDRQHQWAIDMMQRFQRVFSEQFRSSKS